MRYPYYLETDDEAGEVRLLQDGVVVAHAKSRTSLAKIRDALNAPRPLEGAWVSRAGAGGVNEIAVAREAGRRTSGDVGDHLRGSRRARGRQAVRDHVPRLYPQRLVDVDTRAVHYELWDWSKVLERPVPPEGYRGKP